MPELTVIALICAPMGAETAGYRLINHLNGKIVDKPLDDIIHEMRLNALTLVNAKLSKNGKYLEGTNGDINDYPFLNVFTSTILLKRTYSNPIVILARMDNEKYRVTNGTGEVVIMTTENIIDYAKSEGLANAIIDNGHIKAKGETDFPDDVTVKERKYSDRLKDKLAMMQNVAVQLDDSMMAVFNEYMDVEKITKLEIPKGALGVRKFPILPNVEEIIIRGTVKTVESKAFSKFSKLRQVIVEEGVIELGNSCFENCPNLAEVWLPNSLVKIGQRCFWNNPKLKVARISPNIIYLPMGVFPRTTKITKT